MTPLMWAARNNRPEVVKMLIDNGADLNARDKVGYYCTFIYCTLGGKIKVKSVLLFLYCTRFKGCGCAIFGNCAVFAQVCCIFPFDPIQHSLHHNSKQ